MGIRRGEITTKIVSDGLVFNMDAANRASYPQTGTNCFNTLKISQTGSLNNGVTLGTNPQNFIFGADGVDDYIDYGNITECNFGSGNMSVSAWIKTDTIASGNVDIIGIGANGGTRIRLQRRAAKLGGYIDSTSANSLTGGTTINTSNWYNGCITKVGTTFTIYLNGSADGTVSISGNFTDTEVIVGAYFGGGSNYFDGSIGPTQIYNRALSATEVLHNYNALKSRFGL
tara:strand:- start:38 stop:724 length:687 start_codon:yes stop_codon:yes gene_type:complete